ncbi:MULTISPECIES: alpha/beta fold hydrolase [unclassified Cyanobium]|uniref:alpha/beta hydrolase family protein n=1 Tax=unclassified Cyanobium TaxID=2627006 RepID=UPI0020CCFFC7|nr:MULTISPECIES: alpha/beta fold hydrolase [unclassified Cyanobium]MCP9834750.1 dienelactone hydrolase [Cyanobium sp. La Preciosa 7G6]MCP9937389.1 dienelactone hydrolase [Cyanobium sp. Aljojuca 7A6]
MAQAASSLAPLALVLATAIALPPAAVALEQIELKLPLVETTFTIQLAELSDPRALLTGNSDLAELDQATGGAIGQRMVELFNTPLPLQALDVARQVVPSPLAQQALLLLSSLGGVDGLPADVSSETVLQVLDRAAGRGALTMLGVLQAVPGRTATVDVGEGLLLLQRLNGQLLSANRLLEGETPAAVDPGLAGPGPLVVQRDTLNLPVTYRPLPLEVVVIRPSQQASGRLVAISHGLWDGPESFEGWGRHLASHGYTVLLPRHPGSDRTQQQAMLSGKVPPPGPAELRLRPLDISALIDAAAAGQLALPAAVDSRSVVVLGHSWGATTALQLAGARPRSQLLQKRCNNLQDPQRNLSWVLQCSFLGATDQAALADPRVKAVVAVSPPMALLFDAEAAPVFQGRVLLVSGSRDWVVPPGPEAIAPMARIARLGDAGHRLVLVGGGDHFNLGSRYDQGGGPLRGLLLGWVNGAFAAGPDVGPGSVAPALLPSNGWGDRDLSLSDVSDRLPSWNP